MLSVNISGVLPKGRAFVPGCGRGYEAIAFGKNGSDAIGLDLAPTGIKEAKKVLEQEEEAPSGKVTKRGTETLVACHIR